MSSPLPTRYAAVVVPVYAEPPHDVVFVERAQHLRRHAGEIGFPGGEVDAVDGGDHARAALRELYEEVGIPEHAVQIVGRLPVLRQRSGIFTVSPFVGVVAAGTPLIVDPAEAAGVHRVPLAELLAPDAVHPAVLQLPDRLLDTYVFDRGTLRVWGLTGRILHDFVERVRAPDSALAAAVGAALRGWEPAR